MSVPNLLSNDTSPARFSRQRGISIESKDRQPKSILPLSLAITTRKIASNPAEDRHHVISEMRLGRDKSILSPTVETIVTKRPTKNSQPSRFFNRKAHSEENQEQTSINKHGYYQRIRQPSTRFQCSANEFFEISTPVASKKS